MPVSPCPRRASRHAGPNSRFPTTFTVCAQSPGTRREPLAERRARAASSTDCVRGVRAAVPPRHRPAPVGPPGRSRSEVSRRRLTKLCTLHFWGGGTQLHFVGKVSKTARTRMLMGLQPPKAKKHDDSKVEVTGPCAWPEPARVIRGAVGGSPRLSDGVSPPASGVSSSVKRGPCPCSSIASVGAVLRLSLLRHRFTLS